MDSEAALIAGIASNPDDDMARLVFADWLEETGQLDRAGLIRLSCQLDPDRDRFDDEGINALGERFDKLRYPAEQIEREWWASLHQPMNHGVSVEWRRGFVDALALPVQWFIKYGEHFRSAIRCSADW